MPVNFAYDHPAYIGRGAYDGVIPAGNATVERFVAHANLQARASVCSVVVVGTSASQTVILSRISGTTTTALHTHTLVGTALGFVAADLNGVAISRGDELRYTSGTDATVVYGVALDYNVTPGADVGA